MPVTNDSILAPYVQSAHSYVLLNTWENRRVIESEKEKISSHLEQFQDSEGNPITRDFLVWDCVDGLREYGTPPLPSTAPPDPTTNPVKALGIMRDMALGVDGIKIGAKEIKGQKVQNMKILRTERNFPGKFVCFYKVPRGEDYLRSDQWLQAVESTSNLFEARGICIVILSPTMTISGNSPISHTVKQLHSPLPDGTIYRDMILKTVEGTNKNRKRENKQQVPVPKGAGLEQCVESLKGLTKDEAMNAMALSLVRHEQIDSAELFDSKRGQIEATGALSILDATEYNMDNLGGLDNLKQYCTKILSRKNYNKAYPRGVLMLGVPGTGKSHFCKALGFSVNLPVIKLDLTAVRNKYVGESERILREVIRILKSIGRCIVFIDEIEKQVHGGSEGSDGGHAVDNGILSQMLHWMDDACKDGIFFVATCNRTDMLPPEFKRSGRWNATYFIDIPGEAEKDQIWKIWTAYFGVPDKNRPEDVNWTGADIRNCCETADLLQVGLDEASKYVTPIALSEAEKLQALRVYASKYCIDATAGGRFKLDRTMTPSKVDNIEIPTRENDSDGRRVDF